VSVYGAVAVGCEDRCERSGHSQGAEQVGLQHGSDLRQVGVQQRLAAQLSRVVDDDGRVAGQFGKAGDRILVGDIGFDDDHAWIGGRVRTPAGGVDLGGSAGEQFVDDGLAESALAAGDDCRRPIDGV
jgi:hypothetical protein